MILRANRPAGSALREKQLEGTTTRSLHTGPTYQIGLLADNGMLFEIELPVIVIGGLGWMRGAGYQYLLRKGRSIFFGESYF